MENAQAGFGAFALNVEDPARSQVWFELPANMRDHDATGPVVIVFALSKSERRCLRDCGYAFATGVVIDWARRIVCFVRVLVVLMMAGVCPLAAAAINYLNVTLAYNAGTGNYSMVLQVASTASGSITHIYGQGGIEIQPNYDSNAGGYTNCQSLPVIVSIAGVPSAINVTNLANMTAVNLTLGGGSTTIASSAPTSKLPTLALPDGFTIGGGSSGSCLNASPPAAAVLAAVMSTNPITGPPINLVWGGWCSYPVGGGTVPSYYVYLHKGVSTVYAAGFCVQNAYSWGQGCAIGAAYVTTCFSLPNYVIGY